MEFASDGKEKNKPQESECKYWENETEKNKPHKICHIEKIYWTLGNTIESDVFKIYDRDDDRGPRNRDPKNPTATDREPRPRPRSRPRPRHYLWYFHFFTDAFLDVRRVFQVPSKCVENYVSQFWSRLKRKSPQKMKKTQNFRDAPKSVLKTFLSDIFTFPLIFSILRVVRL